MKKGQIHDQNEKKIRKITWIGLIVNLLLSAIKFWAGLMGSSHAVMADAVHSLSDSTTDLAVILGSYFWYKPADQDHPYGHRRIETVVTIFIGFVLLAAGIGIGWESFKMLFQGRETAPGAVAAFAAGISVVCKETLYQWTYRVGQKVKSPALVANAWHHRLDAISSIPALVAVAGAILFPSWAFLDCLGAIVVSVLIIYSSIGIVWPGIQELVDSGASKETCERIKYLADGEGPVKQVHRIRTRYLSSGLVVDLHIVVDGSISVLEGHNIAENVRERIIAARGDVVDVIVHVDPEEAALPEEACDHQF